MCKSEIVMYQPDSTISLEVRMEHETLWLTQAQIAVLFGTKRPGITKHLNNIYKSGELDKNSTCSILEHIGKDGTRAYFTTYYNLDAILSVGYRVNSKNATLFRKWATKTLKDYLLRGYVIQHRIEKLEEKVSEHDKKIDFFVRNALPLLEGIFYDGQIFDAYVFVSDLMRSAKKSIILIDNYIDESVLMLLSKRVDNVIAKIITRRISPELLSDLERHNLQYPSIEITESQRYHDRFLIIDDVVYHIGASLKDLGKKLFAFSKMKVPSDQLIV